MQSSYIGIEIGGTKIQLAAGDGHGVITKRQRFAVDGRDGTGIRELIKQAVADWVGSGSFAGIGVGFGGPVDWEAGRVWKSHHVKNWDGFELTKWLTSFSGLRARVDNDTNTGALAEATLGVGRDARVVFYTNQGTGVGGGLAVQGQIYHGAKPGEAEFGHVLLDRNGTMVEQRCSGRAVDAKIKLVAAANPAGMLAQLIGRETSGVARFLRAAVEAGDATAISILNETADDLAFGLSHVSQLFHPDMIVLGGGLSLIGEAWRSAVAARLPAYVMDVHQPGPQVKLAALGEDVVIAGALLLAAGHGREKSTGSPSTPLAHEKMA